MKRLVLLVTVFAMSQQLYGQSMSPYFPQRLISATDNRDETQMTFVDLNFVNNKIENYLDRRFAMAYAGPKFDLDQGKGTITQNFVTTVGSRGELHFAFEVEAVGEEFLVKSVKITGDEFRVTNFYVGYWTTTMELENPTGNAIATNKYLQDDISYYFNNAKPYILIKNTTIKDTKAFLADLETKMAAHKIEQARIKKEKAAAAKAQKERDEQERIRKEKEEAERKAAAVAERKRLEEERAREAEERKLRSAEAYKKEKELRKAKQDTLKNTFQKRFHFEVVIKKKKFNIGAKENSKDTPEVVTELKKRLTVFMEKKDRGTYHILAHYKTVYGKIKDLEFEVREFTKPGSALLNKVKKIGGGF